MVQHIETKIKFQQIIVFREESEIVDSKKISVSHLPIKGDVWINFATSKFQCLQSCCLQDACDKLFQKLREPSQHDSPLSCNLNPSVAGEASTS